MTQSQAVNYWLAGAAESWLTAKHLKKATRQYTQAWFEIAEKLYQKYKAKA